MIMFGYEYIKDYLLVVLLDSSNQVMPVSLLFQRGGTN